MFTDGLRTHSAALAQCTPLLIATPGQPGGDRLDGGQAAPVRRGIRDGQGRRRPAGPGRSGAQLREHGVASIAVHPGWVPTEGVMQYSDRLDMTGSQSPEQVGRAIAALADDSDLLNLTGRTLRGGRAWAVRPAGTYGWRRSAGNGVMARTGSSS
jgi:dehydrogenase/reductase SDR family protein 1